ncbi:Mobile element protein, partial [hydrothermal vent metagenome]
LMPRFKDYDYNQMKMIPLSFDRQILPGSFEYSLCYLVDHEIDQKIFYHRYINEDNGRPAYDPALLLKIVILAYSKGITSSRKIEALCRENIIFMAISADTRPHFTTVADFISRSTDEIASLFKQVILMCDDLGLIGKDMFAIDGCKLPSNASKDWSGTHSELKKKQTKIDSAVRFMLDKHKQTDNEEKNGEMIDREQQQIKKLKAVSKKIKIFLVENEDRTGISGNVIKSNITDNESAKMKTSHGVIQGYNGVASVDSKHQVVVAAEAYGQGQEHDLLEPMIGQSHQNLKYSKKDKQNTKVTADSGYSNKKTLAYLNENNIDAYIADTGFRSRDPRFKDYKEHKSKTRLKIKTKFKVDDFKVDIKKQTCICPAGKKLWLKARSAEIKGDMFMQFRAYEADCPACPLKLQCLRRAEQKTPRQVNIKLGRTNKKKNSLLEKMKKKIDSEKGRFIYGKRLGTVEPVFGHINTMIGIKRFSLRGKTKVNAQWQLM